MKRYYANLLGEWTDITDGGCIDGKQPQAYFEDTVFIKSYKDEFVEIAYKGSGYKVHTSCLQAVNS